MELPEQQLNNEEKTEDTTTALNTVNFLPIFTVMNREFYELMSYKKASIKNLLFGYNEYAKCGINYLCVHDGYDLYAIRDIAKTPVGYIIYTFNGRIHDLGWSVYLDNNGNLTIHIDSCELRVPASEKQRVRMIIDTLEHCYIKFHTHFDESYKKIKNS
jgi:hypothetical protein